MNYIEIPNKGEYPVPSDWDELDHDQVNKILKLVVKLNSNHLDFDDFIVKSFYIIAGIKRNWISVYRERLRSKAKNKEKLENTYVYAEFYTSFLFKLDDKNELTKEIYYNTVKNFFPTVKVNRLEFVGPQDFLQDLTFGEFRKCIDAMNVFSQDRSLASLNHFFVLLYRPDRSPLAESDLLALAKIASKIPYHIKLASFLWFTTCVSYLTTSELNINGRLINFSPMFPQSKKRKPDEETKKESGLGWLSVLFGIAKEGVFGDADKTDNRSLYDVLLYMYDNHLQNIRLKIAQKK